MPERRSLGRMREAVQACRGCELWRDATQAVFGEGPAHADLVLVGEQPGDHEDRQGHPFVGPAGRLLDRGLESAGIDSAAVYRTNAVKHFKWARDARTKRRIHKTPNAGEIRACHPWLEQEIALIRPRVIVCLGATAAKALLGRDFSVMKKRGVPVESEWAPAVVATVHPSAVLRAPPDQRALAERMFIADIRKVARVLEKTSTAERRGTSQRRKFSAWETSAPPSATSSASTRSSRE